MFRTLGDLNGKKEDKSPKETSSYTGGEKSGLAVENPAERVIARARQEGPSSSSSGPLPNERQITFWANGFTVDNGPFRRYDDPANHAFMSDIGRGLCPAELEAEAGGQPVGIAIEDKRSEEYTPPPPPSYIAFSGDGHSLGSKTAAAPKVSGRAQAVVVDPSHLTTTLQVRLADGSRTTVTVNTSHTVQDLHNHISSISSVPRFDLVAGFPPAPLSNPALTIEAAGLVGSVVTQKKL